MKEKGKKKRPSAVVIAAACVSIVLGLLQVGLHLYANWRFGAPGVGGDPILFPSICVLIGIFLLVEGGYPIAQATAGIVMMIIWVSEMADDVDNIPVVCLIVFLWMAAGLWGSDSLTSALPPALAVVFMGLFLKCDIPGRQLLRVVLVLIMAVGVTAVSVLLGIGLYRCTDNSVEHFLCILDAYSTDADDEECDEDLDEEEGDDNFARRMLKLSEAEEKKQAAREEKRAAREEKRAARAEKRAAKRKKPKA